MIKTITVDLGGVDYELTIDEARIFYEELKLIFCPIAVPVIVPVPYYPPWPEPYVPTVPQYPTYPGYTAPSTGDPLPSESIVTCESEGGTD